ncbi:hypothetical protein BaRGS_00025551 [Batillaria attramentaria]|uniref:Uncharacterized protein n=1 Tax=Batillaria attramentaria TaxID=370345 RepID=A0ABD0K878_9CAEN
MIDVEGCGHRPISLAGSKKSASEARVGQADPWRQRRERRLNQTPLGLGQFLGPFTVENDPLAMALFFT